MLSLLRPMLPSVGDFAISSDGYFFFINAEVVINLVVLFLHCETSTIIFLTYSLVFYSENDGF